MANNQRQKPATTGETVVVALKLPNGLIIQAQEKTTDQEPIMGGGTREVAVFRPVGQQFSLHGNRVPFGKMPNYPIVGGYALTDGVPKDVWENWRDLHKDMPLVRNGLVAAFDDMDSAKDFAKDGKALKSGFEPLALKGDPRVDKKKTRDGKLVDAVSISDGIDDEEAA